MAGGAPVPFGLTSIPLKNYWDAFFKAQGIRASELCAIDRDRDRLPRVGPIASEVSQT